jgi:hypothetical protein
MTTNLIAEINANAKNKINALLNSSTLGDELLKSCNLVKEKLDGFDMLTTEQIQDNITIDYLIELEKVNQQIAQLKEIKEALEARVVALVGHPEQNDDGYEGSKQYRKGSFKFEVTTGWNICINKKEYKLIGHHLPSCFNPVREKIVYKIDLETYREAEACAGIEELALLSQIAPKKPKKLHVKLFSAA